MKKFLLISILLVPGIVFGATISGTVVDEKKVPLPFATIQAQTTPVIGTATDNDGKFTLNNLPEKITNICASFVGFTQKCQILSSTSTTYDFQLEPNPDTTLKDGVVVGHIPCGTEKINAKHHATQTKLFKKNSTKDCPKGATECYCAPANETSCANFYKYENGKCVSIDGDNCTDQIKNADYATWLCDIDIDNYDNIYNTNCTCQLMPYGCELGYEEQDGKCIEIKNKCSAEQKNAIEYGKTFELDTLTYICHVLSCECGYTPDLLNEKCEKITETNCSADNAKTATYECENDRQICKITECNDKYELQGNRCVPIAGSCKPDDPNAKSGRYDTDKSNKKICVIDSCKKYYKLSKDGESCVLANPHSEQELKEKSDNVNKLRDNEQSLANRMTSGVSMGATGIGGMMLAQSLAEQNADKDAEQDMAAYLATFRCEYAGGKSVTGGTNGVQLPADKLFDLYQEYTTLSADLKERKEALGLKPGIESEVILDKANIGLYDDTATGKTNGTYASVARALADPNSADAQKWTEQKEQTAQNLKIGTGLVIGGAGIGAIGNILTNLVDLDKIKDKTNNSKENKDKIKMFKEGLESIGMTNVNKLDFSKLDLTEFDVNSIDFTNITLGDEKDATKLLNTTNAASWKSSFSKIYSNE